MSYRISDGILESELSKWLAEAGQKIGKFKDGRVNYTHADIAPVVMITIAYGHEILLVKRGYGLADAEGYWSTVNGFIDEDKPVKAIAAQELSEELGLNVSSAKIKVGKSYTMKNPKERRGYVVFPCLVKLSSKPRIVLDREHTEFTWIKRDKLESYHILEDLPLTIDAALGLL